jgi:3-dehydroquinate dehydratase
MASIVASRKQFKKHSFILGVKNKYVSGFGCQAQGPLAPGYSLFAGGY